MGLAAIQVQVQLANHVCSQCGIPYAAPDYFWRQRKRDGTGFFCPNGHERVFTVTEAMRLQKQLDAEKQKVEAYKRQMEFERNQHIATKGKLTKANKKIARVENGVCPECRRSFKPETAHGNQTPARLSDAP